MIKVHSGPVHSRRFKLFQLFVAVLILLGLAFVLWPRRSRGEPAWRIKCASQLRMIGLGLKMYANANRGDYPPSFRELMLTQEVTADMFVCPIFENAAKAPGSTREELASQVADPASHYCSYAYAASGLNDKLVTAEDVLAFDPRSNHNGEGMSVLFGDGHVEWVAASGPAAATYEQLVTDFATGVRPLRFRP